MYPSYGLLSHVPTQSLFDTKIGMMQTFSTFSENGYGPATPLRVAKFIGNIFLFFFDNKQHDTKRILVSN